MTEGIPPGQAATGRLKLTPSRDAINRAQQSLLAEVQRFCYDDSSCFAIRLAVEEALSNAFKHGNQNDPTKAVYLNFRVDAVEVEVFVKDEGPGFDWNAVPDPTAAENIEIPAGRGLVLMRAYMTEVHFQSPGNQVRMRYTKPRGSGGSGG